MSARANPERHARSVALVSLVLGTLIVAGCDLSTAVERTDGRRPERRLPDRLVWDAMGSRQGATRWSAGAEGIPDFERIRSKATQ
jgi:hypothetical protein